MSIVRIIRCQIAVSRLCAGECSWNVLFQCPRLAGIFYLFLEPEFHMLSDNENATSDLMTLNNKNSRIMSRDLQDRKKSKLNA